MNTRNHGADIGLVAFMQYLSVVIVAIVATVVGKLFARSSATAPWDIDWFPHQAWLPFLETVALMIICVVGSWRLRVPAGPRAARHSR